MKRLMNFGAAAAALAVLPALALAQTAPQTTPPNQPEQTMPQQMQQRATPPVQKNSPMRQATGARQEIATAHAHALMAQGATSVDMAHTHLHHVINCLEGSSGADFDAEAGNPCKDKGHGAIPDSAGNPAVQNRLKQAVAGAQSGLKADDLKLAQQSAARVASLLQAQPAPGGMMRHPGQ